MIFFMLAEVAVTLLAERALLLAEERTLIVADVHFGKDTTLRARGVPGPAGTTAVDLAGLVVRDVSGASGVVDASVVLAPGALAVLGRGGAGNWNQPDITPDAFYGAAVTLNNSGDALWLANAHGDVAQSVAWGSTTPGASLALVGADPLLLSAWATSTVTLPTTGERATPRAR
jgi:hypothetical protein